MSGATSACVESEPWSRADVIEELAEAMSDAQDMDTRMLDLAKAAVRFLERHGLFHLPPAGLLPVSPTGNTLSIPKDGDQTGSWRVRRAENSVVPSMAFTLGFDIGRFEATGRMTLRQARTLNEVLTRECAIYAETAAAAEAEATA